MEDVNEFDKHLGGEHLYGRALLPRIEEGKEEEADLLGGCIACILLCGSDSGCGQNMYITRVQGSVLCITLTFELHNMAPSMCSNPNRKSDHTSWKTLATSHF